MRKREDNNVSEGVEFRVLGVGIVSPASTENRSRSIVRVVRVIPCVKRALPVGVSVKPMCCDCFAGLGWIEAIFMGGSVRGGGRSGGRPTSTSGNF